MLLANQNGISLLPSAPAAPKPKAKQQNLPKAEGGAWEKAQAKWRKQPAPPQDPSPPPPPQLFLPHWNVPPMDAGALQPAGRGLGSPKLGSPAARLSLLGAGGRAKSKAAGRRATLGGDARRESVGRRVSLEATLKAFSATREGDTAVDQTACDT